MPECKIKFWLFPTPLVVIREEEYLERFQAICVLIPTAHEGAWCGARPTSKDPDMSPGAGEYRGLAGSVQLCCPWGQCQHCRFSAHCATLAKLLV